MHGMQLPYARYGYVHIMLSMHVYVCRLIIAPLAARRHSAEVMQVQRVHELSLLVDDSDAAHRLVTEELEAFQNRLYMRYSYCAYTYAYEHACMHAYDV